MIHDRVENLARYGAGDWWNSLCRVVSGLSDAEPEGERALGEGLLLRVLRYETKPPEKCRFEGHRRHIDIQFSLAGAEGIDVAGFAGAVEDGQYNAAGDAQFYRPMPSTASLKNAPGFFALLFPSDLHRPEMRVEGVEWVKKAVVKVDVGVFERECRRNAGSPPGIRT